jgi:UDP-N-acetylglucosamine 1-carboxyvinyltransferase
MEKFIIPGGQRPKGSIAVSGAKNHALKLFPAALLTDEDVTITNVPDIEDVHFTVAILESLGATVHKKDDHTYTVNCSGVNRYELDATLAHKLRTSVLFLAPLLVRFGHVILPHPGGDVIGKRPINFHLDGFRALGAEVQEFPDRYELRAKQLQGADFMFELQSHTATENMMLAAVMAKGTTTLKFAACEPEVVALADALRQSGARIEGAGTHTITIEGVDQLGGGTWEVIPDRLEAGTFALLSAITASPITITDCDPSHLEIVLQILRRIGVDTDIIDSTIMVKPSGTLEPYHLRTREYPGFPTDLQAPFTVLMTQAKGLSMIHETVFEGRLFYVDYLNRMGADIIMCDPHRVIVNGLSRLYGRYVESPDIRAGMAMILAALVAEGESEIDNIYHIDRGYQFIERRLAGLGLDITRVASS